MIRVLVVDDSLTVRARLAEVIQAAPGFEVVGQAQDGQEAVEKCCALRPDVMTLDMALPRMTGVQATVEIMSRNPTPILIVSASTNRGDLLRTYDALAAGAVDVLEKPLADAGDWEAELLARLRLVARVRVITHLRGRATRHQVPSRTPALETARSPSVVGIGASTGGPAALQAILSALPADFPLPLLIVLHIGAAFESALPEWLQHHAALPVRNARDGEPLPPRGVVLAPAGRHLRLRAGRLCYSDEPPRYSCKPSVDVLFESLAQELGARAIGCLLTGMGRDGAAGLLTMRARGAQTAAQDEASSVVYGMPAEAARLGAAQAILPLAEVAPWLVRKAQVLA